MAPRQRSFRSYLNTRRQLTKLWPDPSADLAAATGGDWSWLKESHASETAEIVSARIRRPVSRQHICFDSRSEGRSAAVWRSRFCVDRITDGEIDFFSGLVENRYLGGDVLRPPLHPAGVSRRCLIAADYVVRCTASISD